MKTTYALIDSNNFFVSCERLFRPDLEGRPVVVLSSNDGCAVSRSQEAKDLGIPMGAPLFKLREKFDVIDGGTRSSYASTMQGASEARREPYNRYGERALELGRQQRAARAGGQGGFAGWQSGSVRERVVAFSANFELYGDISERITTLLTTVTPHIEVYSVDESFLDLTELNITDYTAWGSMVRASILKDVGVPVSVGIAPSKTLCKAANHYAKKHAETGGVVAPLKPDAWNLMLSSTPVEDIWGVGWRLTPKLKAEGIHTAQDLAQMSPRYARQLMGIRGQQMVAELNGTRCLPLQGRHKPQQQIMRGRQFGEDTSDFAAIEAAVANLTARAAAHLRREGQLVRQATVLLKTNRHKPGYQRHAATVRFYTPTDDTGAITSQLVRLLATTYNPRLMYHKADVLLHDLLPADGLQTDLWGAVNVPVQQRAARRMQAFDVLNQTYGKDTLRYAAEALSQAWQPRKKMSSPRYTSAWSDLSEAKLV
jgi:DNA polymerase V